MTDGQFGLTVLKRATPLEMPTVLARVFTAKPEMPCSAIARSAGSPVSSRRASSRLDGRPLPVQVDGDHIGDFMSVELSVEPAGLSVVS